jgi:hypothetical protein
MGTDSSQSASNAAGSSFQCFQQIARLWSFQTYCPSLESLHFMTRDPFFS